MRNIEILVNNRNISQNDFTSDTNIDVDKHSMESNYLGTIALTKKLIPHFRKNKSEQFVVTTSIVEKEEPGLGLVDYNLGLIEYDNGNKEKAVEYFTSAINKTKGETLDFDYVKMQINTLNELGKYTIAIKNIDAILELWG